MYGTYRSLRASDCIAIDQVRQKVEVLRKQLIALKADVTTAPTFGITCVESTESLSPIYYLTQQEISSRAAAVAEIFRLATLVYVLRIIHPPGSDLIPDIHESVLSVISLLPQVPDVVGPGSNLGWAYVVIGAELDDEEQREYIRGRLQGLYSLAMQNVASAEKVLEEVWRNRDEARLGGKRYRHWQEIMQGLGVEQILI